MATDPTQPDPNQPQIELLLSDPRRLKSLVWSLTSSPTKNYWWDQLEDLFNGCKLDKARRQSNASNLCLGLARLLRDSHDPETGTASAVLLRLLFADFLSSLFPLFESEVKEDLLTSLRTKPVNFLTKNICHAVAELASARLPHDDWTNLLDLLREWVNSDQAKEQEICLLIFAELDAHLIPQDVDIPAFFLRCLGANVAYDVRMAALAASINFVQGLTNYAGRDSLEDLLPLMMQMPTDALNSGQEATAQEALKLLIELANTKPEFLQSQIVGVVERMLRVAERLSLEEGTRHLAIEFLVTLVEARERAPGMLEELPQFFVVLMKLLLDVEDDPDAGETSSCGFGQQCLDRLASSLAGNRFDPVASALLRSSSAATEWQKRHAALIALVHIAEGCSEVIMGLVTIEWLQTLSMVLKSLTYSYLRVEKAAKYAVGQLPPDLVLRTLVHAMCDFQIAGSKAHAVVEGIVSKLLVNLQDERQRIQEEALTDLASVAVFSREQFQKYYDDVMPYLKDILVVANAKSYDKLCVIAMECIESVGMAVGKDKFRDDAETVMDILMSRPQSRLDPTLSCMLQEWERLYYSPHNSSPMTRF